MRARTYLPDVARVAPIGTFVASSGRDYSIQLTAGRGVTAVCTPRHGPTVVLDVLESSPGPLVFRRDESEDARELASHLGRWFATRTRHLPGATGSCARAGKTA